MTEPDDERARASILDPAGRDLEAPPEDALEQAIPADPAADPGELRIGLEVDEADALDQAAVVPGDDDEY